MCSVTGHMIASTTYVVRKLSSFLIKQVGFKEDALKFIPCSDLVGDSATWTSMIEPGATLINSIDSLQGAERGIDKPLRFCVADVYKSAQTAAISLAGKLESGSVKVGDRVCLVPSGESGQVKAINTTNDDQSLQAAFAGDSVVLNVANVDMNKLAVGHFVCDTLHPPMPVSDRIRARIILFNLELPFVKGFPVVLHYKSTSESAVVKRLVSQLNKSTGEVIKDKPRFLTKGMSAIVELKINKPMCLEAFHNNRDLGRFMLRNSGVTIAAGQITEVGFFLLV